MPLCYNTFSPQDSYIGNTTASQAVKAGSTPVSCSKNNGHLNGVHFLLEIEKGVEPIYMQMSSGYLLAPVQKLVPTYMFFPAGKEHAYRLPYPAPKKWTP